jgi:hypothetical protein
MLLAIPILHHPMIHGDKNFGFNGHFICHDIVSPDIFLSCRDNLINQRGNEMVLNMIKNNMHINSAKYNNYDHPVRNYWKIAKEPKIELVTVERLETGEDVCIIKTHIIKQIQRRWRKILYEREKPSR